MASQISPQQALIYTMITIAAVDRDISDKELARIGSIVKHLPAFDDYNTASLVTEAQDCGKVLSGEKGLNDVLDLITAALPEGLRETAYALAAEIAATDRDIKREEIRFLDLLGGRLELDKLTCSALERAASARHQKA